MFLSDRDLRWAIETGRLIVEPKPESYDSTSLDLHLDAIDQAKVWDLEKIAQHNQTHGLKEKEVRIGRYHYSKFSGDFLKALPVLEAPPAQDCRVYRRGHEVVVRPGGFLLWQTKEVIGTPDERADLICFIERKSTRARAGLLVHLTAPTIHSTWRGKVTLEMANLGPLTFVLEANDVVAQLTVATISSPPRKTTKAGLTYGQSTVTGQQQP